MSPRRQHRSVLNRSNPNSENRKSKIGEDVRGRSRARPAGQADGRRARRYHRTTSRVPDDAEGTTASTSACSAEARPTAMAASAWMRRGPRPMASSKSTPWPPTPASAWVGSSSMPTHGSRPPRSAFDPSRSFAASSSTSTVSRPRGSRSGSIAWADPPTSGRSTAPGWGILPEELRNWPRPVKTDDRGRFSFAGIGRDLTVDLHIRDPRFADPMDAYPDR